MPLDKKYYSYFSTKTYVVGIQKNPINEHVEHPKQQFKLRDKRKYSHFYDQKFVYSDLCFSANANPYHQFVKFILYDLLHA